MTQQTQSKNIHSTPTLKKRKSVPKGTHNPRKGKFVPKGAKKDYVEELARKFIEQAMELKMGHIVPVRVKPTTQNNGNAETIFETKLGTVGVLRKGHLCILDTAMKEFKGALPIDVKTIPVRNIKSDKALWCKKCRNWRELAKVTHCEKGHWLVPRKRFTNESISEWDASYLGEIQVKKEIWESKGLKIRRIPRHEVLVECLMCGKDYNVETGAGDRTCDKICSTTLQKIYSPRSVRAEIENQEAVHGTQWNEKHAIASFKAHLVYAKEDDKMVKYLVTKPDTFGYATNITLEIGGKTQDEHEKFEWMSKECYVDSSIGERQYDDNFQKAEGTAKILFNMWNSPEPSLGYTGNGDARNTKTRTSKNQHKGKDSRKQLPKKKPHASHTSMPKANEEDVKKNQSVYEDLFKKTEQPVINGNKKFRSDSNNKIAKSTEKTSDEEYQHGCPDEAIVSKTN